MITILIIIAWALCSFLSYGITFAYWSREWHAFSIYKYDMRWSIAFSLMGPLSLAVAIFFSDFCKHGFKIK